MGIKKITDKVQWENFVQSNRESTFLQSWNWGEFNKNTGEKIWRLGVFNNEELLTTALVIKVDAKRGSFLFIPQGPIIKSSKFKVQSSKLLRLLFDYLKDLAKKEKVSFVRISPILENSKENLDIFKRAGFRNAPIHMMHPELTWVLDITKNEDEIMKEMRKTHRNLIRRAKKEGVEIIQSKDEEYIEAFYNIHMETVRRHKFVPFSYNYIKNEIEAFKNDNQIEIFSAKYNNEIISSAVIVFYGEQAFYHHGSSSSRYYKIPSSYLNLWEAIREAKKRGKKKFNFYGIVENKPKHPWNGLSKFKKGFGGYKKELLHCQDLPLNKKYAITWLIEKIRKIKRGY
jgi:lipid II:glycine glycyltransferase (peptidoglycan interpeptide bridge formation enzyme)